PTPIATYSSYFTHSLQMIHLVSALFHITQSTNAVITHFCQNIPFSLFCAWLTFISLKTVILMLLSPLLVIITIIIIITTIMIVIIIVIITITIVIIIVIIVSMSNIVISKI
uniref:ABC transmembrane type-1 domain-containing protein n=1 Tax=Amphimedon queenslandica TaxID=400682 RepID=A0A1X7V8L6_AMPQE